MHAVQFDAQFDAFLAEQRSSASVRRKEMLEKELTGTIKLFKEVLWPVFKSFEGFELEYEMKSSTGVSVFIDVFYKPYQLAFECEGFGPHAETISRRRFDFEKSRVRTMLLYGYVYIPFSWDELDEKGPHCRGYVEELLGRYTGGERHSLNIYESEVIRYGAARSRTIKLRDVCLCLNKKDSFCRRVLKSLLEKKLIEPANAGLKRNHEFKVSLQALKYLR